MQNFLQGFWEATGKIDYCLTNDYMFRALLQTNAHVLRGLIGALLHLHPDKIRSVTIENPIELGKAISNKDYILDIRVLLNNNTVINLEMQVENKGNWTDRSLLYLCRCFDRLQKGEPYEDVLPAIHIGILDYTLFPDEPEFYASNQMHNVKTHKVFNDKFTLNVLSLKQIDLATDEDKAWQIDTWAKLFAAKTWRDIKMIAKNNNILTDAAQSLYKLNSDELIREQCQYREDFEKHERTVQRDFALLRSQLAEKDEQLKQQQMQLCEQNKQLNKKDALIASLQKQLAEKNS